MSTKAKEAELVKSIDARLWAQEFRKTAVKLGYSDMDEGWLIGWFANAIMAGHDHVLKKWKVERALEGKSA